MKMFKRIGVSIVAFLLFTSMSIPVFAAQVTSSATYPFTYHDSLISPLVVGEIDSTFTWTYDNQTQKLVDKKNLTENTSHVFPGCFFNNINKYWAWYDTTSVRGTAEGTISWTFNIGVPTPWGTIGTSQDNNMTTNITWN